jgi:isoleucyl-tRNA synthetase
LGEHVLIENGTGCVHTAPGHGEDDYYIGLKYSLEVIMPVDEEGKFDNTIDRLGLLPNEFVGVHIFDANPKILELLGDALLKESKFIHPYPYCWRTHKPVIFRATKQWFISMDSKYKDEKTLREIALNEIESINFYPESGKNRLKTMIQNRPDWCISRQRDWGVPIAFFRDRETKALITDEKVLNYIAFIFEKVGTDAWYSMSIAELLAPNSGLNPENLEKEMDILDVWFDSGSTWSAVLKSGDFDAGSYPATIYLEGSDQHRGWFQSSLLLSCAINGHSPFKNIITHGFIVDSSGNKMSKSVGNVIAPEKIIKDYGSEILRLWVASSDYEFDIKIGDNILKQVAENYRKIRNTFRFLLANIDDLDTLSYKFDDIDIWILSKAKTVFDTVVDEFKRYEFAKGITTLNAFINKELSGIYLDICKDRLYCDKIDSDRRRASQTAMYLITTKMLPLIAPILTYTADEIVEFSPKIITQKSIFDFKYEAFDEFETSFDSDLMMSAREKFFEIVDELKKEKLIKSTLELTISSNYPNLNEDWFLVSSINQDGETIREFYINDTIFSIKKASANKCPRCWKHSVISGELCDRCNNVING